MKIPNSGSVWKVEMIVFGRMLVDKILNSYCFLLSLRSGSEEFRLLAREVLKRFVTSTSRVGARVAGWTIVRTVGPRAPKEAEGKGFRVQISEERMFLVRPMWPGRCHRAARKAVRQVGWSCQSGFQKHHQNMQSS